MPNRAPADETKRLISSNSALDSELGTRPLIIASNRGPVTFSRQADGSFEARKGSGGVVTAIPLILFGAAAVRIPLTTIGLLQYIAPTLQLICGLIIFHEPFESARATGFVLIWIGLAIYAGNALWRARGISSATT